MINRILFLITSTLLILGGWLLISTETGLQWNYQIAKQVLPGSLQIESLKGRLIGPIEIKQLSWQTKKEAIKIESIQFDWDLPPLLNHTLSLRRLNVKNIAITKSDLSPIPIRLQSIVANQLYIKTNHVQFDIRITQTPEYQTEVRGNIQFGKNPSGSINANVNINTALISSEWPGSIRLSLQGTPAAHDFNLDLQRPEQRLTLKSQGSWHRNQWNAQIKTLSMSDLKLGAWQSEKPIDLNLIARSNDMLDLIATVFIGKEPLKITGRSEYRKPDMPTILHFSGENLLIHSTDNIIAVSPDLTLQYKHYLPFLTGKIIIPSANIQTAQFAKAEQPSNDIVFTDAPELNESAFDHFAAQISLIFGKDVYFNAKGLRGRLTGEMTITSETDKPLFADGTLTIENGQYTALGKVLTLTTGQIIYHQQLLANPNLKIEATNRVTIIPQQLTPASLGQSVLTPVATNETVIVGILVQGTVKNPQIQLFSRPAGFSQNDILSLLITGRTMNQASPADAALILQAAGNLDPTHASSKFEHLRKDLQSTLGLDELRIGTQQQINPETGQIVEGTSLILGKQISKRLYVSSSVGLFGSLASVQARYQLYRKLFLQADASTYGQGADLLYSFESKN